MRMNMSRVLTAVLFAIALMTASAFSYAHGHMTVPFKAQLTQSQTVAEPVVLSGADIGFRMHGHRSGRPVGTLVVRVDGECKEVEFASGVKLTGK